MESNFATKQKCSIYFSKIHP